MFSNYYNVSPLSRLIPIYLCKELPPEDEYILFQDLTIGEFFMGCYVEQSNNHYAVFRNGSFIQTNEPDIVWYKITND